MFDLESYTIIAGWFPRLLGLIYFFSFGAFLVQIRGLIGENGILPIDNYLDKLKIYYPKKRFLIAPSLFWFNSSNLALMTVTSIGAALSLLLLFGFMPALMLFFIYVLYLSIVSTGQEFLGFGWEGFLLEVTAHAFLLSMTPVPNLMVWISANFLLFRFHIQAGAVKLQSKDPNWRNLTAIAYHYQTQPLPNTIAWYFYKLPMWFHKQSCLMMFIIELIVPFGIFFGQDIRLGVFFAFFALQFFIWMTGNLSFLNYLTVVLCTILLNNDFLNNIAGLSAPEITATSIWLSVILYIGGSSLLILQIIRFWHHFYPNPLFGKILNITGFFHLANRYGIFAVMTTKRYEVVIEGSDDNLNWKEYSFKYKPSKITRRPGRISPYQPRIDWQAWFLPFSNYEFNPWFQSLLYNLLKGNKDVLYLLGENPFPNEPPKYVRAIVYDYVFSSFEEKRKKGWWWHRTFVGSYSPVLFLRDQRDVGD